MAIVWLIEMPEFAVFGGHSFCCQNGKMKLKHASVDQDRKITLKENQAQDPLFFYSFYWTL